MNHKGRNFRRRRRHIFTCLVRFILFNYIAMSYPTYSDLELEIQNLEEENKKLKEDNELLNNELAWMKAHTRYNWITQEEYIDWTMSVTEAKLRMRQAKDKQNYISKLEEERDNCLKEVKLCYNDIHSLEWQISDLEKEDKNLKEKLEKQLWEMLFDVRS